MLARVQTVWAEAVGPTVAANARPVAEREGVLTVACSASVWTAELTMIADELLARVNAALCGGHGAAPLSELRCRTG
jgi:predicted nucleic acid-binding Zn ribbon protein